VQQRQWRLIYDCPSAGARNMAADVALLESVGAGLSVPVLRLYAWSPPCLSLGYGQRVSDADRGRLTALGWGIVRRPTGGRAILHTDELTYSVALPADHPLAAGSVVESYRRLSAALMAALDRLGAAPRAEPKQTDDTHPEGPVCFEVPSHYEITIGGRKLVGSAQVRRSGGLLQHGSLPLTGDLARICDGLAYDSEAEREASRQMVHQRALTLAEALGQAVSWDAAAQTVCAGFEQALLVALQPSEYTAAERARAQALEAEYADEVWTARR
jgi:lipoate-protein ligase A